MSWMHQIRVVANLLFKVADATDLVNIRKTGFIASQQIFPGVCHRSQKIYFFKYQIPLDTLQCHLHI